MIPNDGTERKSLAEIMAASAIDASRAFSVWLGREVHVRVEPVELVSLESAVHALGPDDAIRCVCCMRVSGLIQGHLLFAFDDPSGLAISAAIISALHAPSEPATATKTASEWGELTTSAAVETANIVGCAFLNALSSRLRSPHGVAENPSDASVIPSPPVFARDYAAALMQCVLLDGAADLDRVLVAKTHFTMDGLQIAWDLFLLPDATSLQAILETAA